MGTTRKAVDHAKATVASTSTSGASSGYECQASDDIMFNLNVTAVTAGSVLFSLESSLDSGVVWCPVPEAIGKTDAVSSAAAHRIAARAPIGTQVRLVYTITTGPVAFTYQARTSKRGVS